VGVAAYLVLTSAPAFAQQPGEYLVGPGDVLRVDVYDKVDLSGDYVVGTAGALTFPYCGAVPVADKTLSEAQQTVRACLLDGVLVDPQVTVRVAEFRSRRVEVRGAVNKPGPYYLQGATTLRAIIGLAGDVQADRVTGAVTVVRGDGRTTVSMDQLDGDDGSVLVEAGDVILVEQGAVVLVGGQVENPGPILFSEGLTVTEALVRAGDATGVANLAASYVLREGEKISVNLKKMRKGRGADFVLEPGDTLVVPESPF
jgi:polysaccharide biosynthesis/export protein